MEELLYFVGVVGNIISVLMFLSPIETFWRIVRNRSTEDFESFPYICTLLNSSLWTFYGAKKPGEFLVATVNGFGVVAEATYVILFLIFAPSKMRLKTAILVGILNVGFFAGAILVTGITLKGDARLDSIGFMCAGLNILMYGSPLAALKTVMTTRSVDYMPFLLSFFFFLNGGTWTIYALLVHDIFLMVPNGIGFLLGATQLLVYAIYRTCKPKRNSLLGSLEEDGSPDEPLIISSSSPNGVPHNSDNQG